MHMPLSWMWRVPRQRRGAIAQLYSSSSWWWWCNLDLRLYGPLRCSDGCLPLSRAVVHAYSQEIPGWRRRAAEGRVKSDMRRRDQERRRGALMIFHWLLGVKYTVYQMDVLLGPVNWMTSLRCGREMMWINPLMERLVMFLPWLLQIRKLKMSRK